MANYQTPRPMNLSELKSDVVRWEQKYYKASKPSLSQALDDKRFIEAWDLSDITTAEVGLIHEKYTKSQSDCLVLVHLKKQ